MTCTQPLAAVLLTQPAYAADHLASPSYISEMGSCQKHIHLDLWWSNVSIFRGLPDIRHGCAKAGLPTGSVAQSRESSHVQRP